MFQKMKLKSGIRECKRKIRFLEQKRSRSQAALVEAILTHTTPDDTDVEYFNMFTERIENERNKMHELMDQLIHAGN